MEGRGGWQKAPHASTPTPAPARCCRWLEAIGGKACSQPRRRADDMTAHAQRAISHHDASARDVLRARRGTCRGPTHGAAVGGRCSAVLCSPAGRAANEPRVCDCWDERTCRRQACVTRAGGEMSPGGVSGPSAAIDLASPTCRRRASLGFAGPPARAGRTCTCRGAGITVGRDCAVEGTQLPLPTKDCQFLPPSPAALRSLLSRLGLHRAARSSFLCHRRRSAPAVAPPSSRGFCARAWTCLCCIAPHVR